MVTAHNVDPGRDSSPGALIGVLGVQGDVAEHRRLLEVVGARTRRIRRPEELQGLDGLLIPGGESTTIWRLCEDFGLMNPISGLIDEGMPTFGSCAGMIMLADTILDGRPDQRSFGGLDITVRRNAFGRQVDSFEAGLDIPAIGQPAFPGVFIRAPWVERTGPAVDVLAQVPGPTPHPVAVRQGVVLATAFHPEVTDDPRLHALFVAMARG